MSGFDDTPHNCDMRIYIESLGYIDHDGVTDELVDAVNKVYRRTFHFATSPGISEFRTEINGATTSAGNLFNVTEMLYWT